MYAPLSYRKAKYAEISVSNGLEVESPTVRRLVKGELQTVSVDLPARALVLNMQQFNGKNGCSVYFGEGESPPNLPMLRYYPFSEENIPRTHDSFVRDARLSVEEGESVNGVKGACPLVTLRYVDMPKLFVIDWMHSVMFGVVESLLSLWLYGKRKDEDFYIGDKVYSRIFT